MKSALPSLKLILSVAVILLIVVLIIHLSSKYPTKCYSCDNGENTIIQKNINEENFKKSKPSIDYNSNDVDAFKEIEKFESGFISYISKGIYDDYLY